VLLAIAVLLAREGYWRSQGFFPTIRDDRDLWCQMREAASSGSGRTIALLGASRMRRGVSPRVLAERCPGYRVLQLAVDGSPPLPGLRDLAADERFRGIVVCSISAQFVVPEGGGKQQDRYVAYYHTEWNVSKKLDRMMRTALQRTFVIAQLGLSWRVLVRQVLDGERPRPPAFREYADRFATIDFERPDVDPSTREGARRFAIEWSPRSVRRAHQGTTYEQWLAHLDEIEDAVRRIQARGGRVLFLRCVSDGPVRIIEEHFFPRAKYWDIFARSTSAVAIHFEDVPAMRAFSCPEWVHLDHRDTIKFTRILADELRRRGIVHRLGDPDHRTAP
jgi:hypothetical protein